MSSTGSKKCVWKDCPNEADPPVEGVSGPFDEFLCPYHDEFPVDEADKRLTAQENGPAGVQNVPN